MDDEIELRHLRYFLAVADTLHFSRAAKRLGIAQPPLSQQIRRLETLIGHRLFDRTTRGVRLTLAGTLLAERARGTLERVQDDLAQVRRLGRGEEGTLTVGFSGSVMFTKFPDVIELYRRRFRRSSSACGKSRPPTRLRLCSTARSISPSCATAIRRTASRLRPSSGSPSWPSCRSRIRSPAYAS
jgi:DNA-binding transcriptional LysR family regulator